MRLIIPARAQGLNLAGEVLLFEPSEPSHRAQGGLAARFPRLVLDLHFDPHVPRANGEVPLRRRLAQIILRRRGG